MKDIVIISGKGGTGKTSVAGSFATLADSTLVLADCDEDAADLYLTLKPDVKYRAEFTSGRRGRIRPETSISCGACLAMCRFGAVVQNQRGIGVSTFTIDHITCERCDECLRVCRVKAIDLAEQACG